VTVPAAAAVILAAGAGARFGGGKLGQILGDRPILRHVVDAAHAAGLEPIVVVVPPDGELDDIDLGPVVRVTNPHAEEGLSSSVRIGLRALDADASVAVEAAVILPGDQPLVQVDTIRALVAAAAESPRTPFVVARHAGDGTPSPVLARRSIWRLADELAGDRGFGPLLGTHPELVRDVAVPGSNPDVDTPADLDRLRATGAESPDVS
jgi:CTP:molybdopterin cytidylyltransferase MocA